MKRKTEQKTEVAVKILLETLKRNEADTGTVLKEYEDTHDDHELCDSRPYNALVTGHFALKAAIDKINNQLNK